MAPFILGSAGWAQRYAGQSLPRREALVSLLRHAHSAGLHAVDSSPLYGRVESCFAAGLLRHCPRVRVISKVKKLIAPPPLLGLMAAGGKKPLLRGMLLHDFDHYRENPGIWERLQRWQQQGLVEKIGFSLYYPRQLEYLLRQSVAFDLIQLPYNVLDRRFFPYLAELRDRGAEVHLRSVFLQGQLLRPPRLCAPWLIAPLASWHTLCTELRRQGLSAIDLCLGVARATGMSLVLGLRERDELLAALRSWRLWPQVSRWLDTLDSLRCEQEDWIVPSHWPVKGG